MQALSLWPSVCGLCVVPQLDFELGSSCFSSTKSRKVRCGHLDNCVHCTNSGLFMVSGNSWYGRSRACCRSSEFHVKNGFLSGCSKVKLVVFSVSKKGSCGSSVALASTLENQELVNEFHSVELSLDDGLSEETEGDGDSGGEVKEVEFSGTEEVGGVMGRRINVRALAQSLQFAESANDVEEVLKDKDEVPLQVFVSVIKGFGWEKRMEPAFAIVEWLKRKKETGSTIGPNLFVYNSLLSAVKQSELYEETEKIINDMAQEGIVPNVITYNILMVIYIAQGQPPKALDILEEMRGKGITPSSASYSTALLAYRKMEDGNGALNFFGEIKEKYLKGEIGESADEDWEKEFVKLESFIIRICCQVLRRWLVKRVNLSTDVLKLLTNMDRVGLQPGREEYERLVWACTREEHYVVVKELYIRIRETYGEISLSVCNHVIWLMGKAKKWWAALEIYEDLLEKGPKPNNLSHELIISFFNVLLNAAKKRGIWRWGVRLLNKMEEKGLKPRSREWNAVLVACSKASETSAAVQLFRRMIEQGEKPTVVSYGALLSALEKGKLYDEALRVWEHMLKVEVKPNLYVYTIMGAVFAAQGKFRYVDAIIHEMVSSNVEPTVVTYNAIITACARNGMSSAAYEWFHRMKVQNLTPNEISYEWLIEALANDGKPRIAYELYLRAKSEGLNLSSKPYDAVLDSSDRYGATIDMDALGPRPPDRKKKVQIRKTLTEFCHLAGVPRRSRPFDERELYVPRTEGNP